MKKILYISNIEVPYRTVFFNELAKKCKLTVIYERKRSSNRNENWSKSETGDFIIIFLKGIKFKKEYSFDLRILKYIFSKKFDYICIGCMNSPLQIFAILLMRIFKIPYILNLDGDYYFEGKSFKNKIKRFILKKADKYLVAGEITGNKIKKLVKNRPIYTYYFSSLTRSEITSNAERKNNGEINKVLIVGQYENYKGLDLIVKCAKYDNEINYLIVGSGNKSASLIEYIKSEKINNIEVIPFLEKKELFDLYSKCKMLVLPSRKECWGLVINEAASFGCPIVSSLFAGAGYEFLYGDYMNYLVDINEDKNLYNVIKQLYYEDSVVEYKNYLIKKSENYYIEKSAEIYIEAFNN